jgi:transposase InsO family protein
MFGKLHKSSHGGHVYMLVAVKNFTKWIEAKPVTTAEATTSVNFVESIFFRFGVPRSIITDNGSSFTLGDFKEFCDKLGIQLKFASVAHPQMNGQAEKANGLICSGIKKRLLTPLKRANGAWVEELPSIL